MRHSPPMLCGTGVPKTSSSLGPPGHAEDEDRVDGVAHALRSRAPIYRDERVLLPGRARDDDARPGSREDLPGTGTEGRPELGHRRLVAQRRATVGLELDDDDGPVDVDVRHLARVDGRRSRGDPRARAGAGLVVRDEVRALADPVRVLNVNGVRARRRRGDDRGGRRCAATHENQPSQHARDLHAPQLTASRSPGAEAGAAVRGQGARQRRGDANARRIRVDQRYRALRTVAATVASAAHGHSAVHIRAERGKPAAGCDEAVAGRGARAVRRAGARHAQTRGQAPRSAVPFQCRPIRRLAVGERRRFSRVGDRGRRVVPRTQRAGLRAVGAADLGVLREDWACRSPRSGSRSRRRRRWRR